MGRGSMADFSVGTRVVLKAKHFEFHGEVVAYDNDFDTQIANVEDFYTVKADETGISYAFAGPDAQFLRGRSRTMKKHGRFYMVREDSMVPIVGQNWPV